jgi:hydroxymethylpyrimidine/phosphomethylpyrimidine kinase
LAALIATGLDLSVAASEALHYLDRCLDEGFRPGMGHVIPDRLFWALPETEEGDEGDEGGPDMNADFFEMPINETKH